MNHASTITYRPLIKKLFSMWYFFGIVL